MIRPIRDQVLVRQDPKKEKLKSGLFLPQMNDRDLQDDTGTVIAVGPKVLDVRAGDRVMFERKPGSALNPDTREGKTEWDDLVMLPEANIIGVLEDE